MYPQLSMLSESEWILMLLIIVGTSLVCYRTGFHKGKREGERTQLQRQVDQIRKKQTIETGTITSQSKN